MTRDAGKGIIKKASRTQLKRLIREGCDEIIVMDYEDEKLVENLSTETRYCARCGKTCQVALLIRPPREDEGEEESAYWAGGKPALHEAFDRIRAEYGDEVGFSVRHAGFLSEFLTQDGEWRANIRKGV